ncbi:MAG: YjfB family protein [Oscillospiraceae bacterium]|nr:YjfB family protein [Oscillospiraceae bacterium]
MGVSRTVDIMVNNATADAMFQNKVSVGILKKTMDFEEMVSTKLLESLPDVRPLAPAGEIGSNIDVYA